MPPAAPRPIISSMNRAARLLPVAAVAILAAPSAFASGAPAARVAALLDASPQFFGTPAPLETVPPPPAPRAAAAAAAPGEGSVVPADLAASLPTPDATTLGWLVSRIPGLDASAVRLMTPAAADAVFSAAAAEGITGLDLFTDPAFRGRDAHYLPQALVARMFDRYEMRVLTPASGTTIDGRPFRMKGLMIGRGRIDVLYDLDQFSFDNPFFPDGEYKCAAHVVQTINGPGDLSIDGISVRVSVVLGIKVDAAIQRLVKTGPRQVRVDTDHGSRAKSLSPIVRR